MKYIYAELHTNNPALFEEGLDYDIIQSITIDGKDGFEIANDDILGLYFSVWVLKIVPIDENNIDNVISLINDLSKKLGLLLDNIKIIKDDEDYIVKNQQQEEIIIEDFIIYNNLDKYTNNIKSDNKYKTPIFVDYSTAFGTGKHESTRLCLEYISILAQNNFSPRDVLDLGTGSGILAIGASKKYKQYGTKVYATDIDPMAIEKAKSLFVHNNVSIECDVSNGFDNINKQAKFSMIIANILLKPLMELKEDFYRAIDERGVLIVAGILDEQVDTLVDEYKSIGLDAVSKRVLNGWSAIMFTKTPVLKEAILKSK